MQKQLQDPKMNFHEACNDIKALRQIFSPNRDKMCEEAIVKGKERL